MWRTASDFIEAVRFLAFTAKGVLLQPILSVLTDGIQLYRLEHVVPISASYCICAYNQRA